MNPHTGEVRVLSADETLPAPWVEVSGRPEDVETLARNVRAGAKRGTTRKARRRMQRNARRRNR